MLTFDERIGNRFMNQPEDKSITGMTFAKIRAVGAVLDARLANRNFTVSNHLTLADFDIAAPFSQNERTKVPFNEFPNLVAWQQRLLDTLPAWAATKREVDDRIDSALAGAGITL